MLFLGLLGFSVIVHCLIELIVKTLFQVNAEDNKNNYSQNQVDNFLYVTYVLHQ